MHRIEFNGILRHARNTKLWANSFHHQGLAYPASKLHRSRGCSTMSSTRSSAMSSGTPCGRIWWRGEQWPWSSLRRGERDDPAFPILSPWPLPRPADWLEIVNCPQSEAELNALHRCVRRGCPYGSAEWTGRTAKQLGIESTLRAEAEEAAGRRQMTSRLPSLPKNPNFVGGTFFPPMGHGTAL